MDNLPHEILQHIILYCTPDDINNLSSVNKSLYDVCYDSYTWYKLIDKNFSKLPNYESCKDYRNIYYNIWYSDFTTLNFEETCVDTFYCTAYIYIKNLHMCKSFNKSLFKFVGEDDVQTCKIFLRLTKEILTSDKYMELIYFTKKTGQTILHAIDDAEITQVILDEIEDKNGYCLIRDDLGETPLFYSGEKMSAVLLNNVEDPESYCSIQNIDGDTALFKNSGNEKILLSYVKDKDKYCRHVNNKNRTALMKINTSDSLQVLLDNVYDIDDYCSMINDKGNTVLHFLMKNKYLGGSKIYELVCTLLKNINDIDEFCSIRNRKGDTVLHLLMNNKHLKSSKVYELVHILLKNINDIDKFCSIQNRKEQTALHNEQFIVRDYIKYGTKSGTIVLINRLNTMGMHNEYLIRPVVYFILESVKDLNTLLNITDHWGSTILGPSVGSEFIAV